MIMFHTCIFILCNIVNYNCSYDVLYNGPWPFIVDEFVPINIELNLKASVFLLDMWTEVVPINIILVFKIISTSHIRRPGNDHPKFLQY